MKKKIIRFISMISLVFILVSCQNKGPISLSAGDYTGQVITTEVAQLDAKMANKDSFVLYLTSSSCSFCQSFTPYVEASTAQLSYTVYKLFFHTLTSDHAVYKKVKFTPAILIVNKGKIMVTLDPTKDKDMQYFESLDGYNTWIRKYVQFQ